MFDFRGFLRGEFVGFRGRVIEGRRMLGGVFLVIRVIEIFSLVMRILIILVFRLFFFG